MPLPLATAASLAVIALLLATLIRPRYRQAGLWFAVLALGQGAALSMVAAGPFTRYQHYASLSTLVHDHLPALLIVGLQAALVVIAWVRRLATGTGTGARWRVALAVALSAATAATVSPAVSRYLSELLFAAAIQSIAIGNVVLMALAWPHQESDRPPANVDLTAGVGRTTWMAACSAFLLSALLCVFAYERFPHVPDEVVYIYHARYLAEGHLALPPPPVPAAFDVDLMEYEPTRWYSPVPPGWPFALAAGAFVGAPWLVNPILAGVNVLLTSALLGCFYSRRAAARAALLLALSPWFVFLGMSFMPHQLMLTSALVAALGVAYARQTSRAWWGLVAGVGIGAVSLIRPLDGVIVGLLTGAWAIGVGGSRLKFSSLAALAVGTAMVGALVFPYNRMLTGDPLSFPINSYVSKHYTPNANSYGFGPDRGMGWPTDPNPGHTPVDGMINANLNTFSINMDLFGWATGSLILVTWLLCSGAWRRTESMLFAIVIGFAVAYFPYYFSGGPDFGARYWFPAIVALVALTVRAADVLAERWGPRAWAAVAALTAMTMVTYVPWRAADKYYHYRGMRADVRALAAGGRFGSDLVLVRGKRFPDYASAFAENPVDLKSRATIYAWDRDPETRAAVLHEYRERRVWILEGPSITGAGYRIAAGPIDAAVLLEGAR